MFKFNRSLLALVAAVCLYLPVAAGEIPNPSQPTPPTSGSTVQGEIPNPSIVDKVLGWLASIF